MAPGLKGHGKPRVLVLTSPNHAAWARGMHDETSKTELVIADLVISNLTCFEALEQFVVAADHPPPLPPFTCIVIGPSHGHPKMNTCTWTDTSKPECLTAIV